MDERRVRVTGTETAERSWGMATARPGVPVAQHVGEYQGWWERLEGVHVRRHPPIGLVPVIINFEPGFRNLDVATGEERETPSFVAGLFDTPAHTVFDDIAGGVQINFTPVGARLFTGLSMHELSNRAVSLDDVFGPEGRELVDRLLHAQQWERRFDILDAFIARRIGQAKPVTPAVAYAWRRLSESDGQVSVTALAAELGWSRKHLVSQFREHIGMAPKMLARVLRFGRVVRRVSEQVEAGREVSWLRLAMDAGYYDQSHFIRDFTRFAGATPTEYMALQLPDGGGMSGEGSRATRRT